MQPTEELATSLEQDKVEAARRMTTAQKLLAGPRLFDLACEFALADIRRKNPGAPPAHWIELLRERVRIALELEDSPWKPKPSRSR